jgi:hypothetical protein
LSFDLAVFEPSAVPQHRKEFLAWFHEQATWPEDHGYNNPDVCSPALRRWFDEMRQLYPPINGPYASDDYDNPKVTDYCIGRGLIYVAFAWSQAEAAYEEMFRLAAKNRVGFFYVSADDGEVWVPMDGGNYACVHGSSAVPGTPRVITMAIGMKSPINEDSE